MNHSVGSGPAVESHVSGRLVWVLRGLCTAGLLFSAYLAWTAIQMGEVIGCGGDGSVFDCSHVLTSKWSKVMGIPVSVPAFGLYASLLTILAFIRRDAPESFRAMLMGGLTLGSLMAALAALWFIALQVFVIEHLCWYCLTVHTCGLVLAGLVLSNRMLSFSRKSRIGSLAATGIAVLMAIQVMTPEVDQNEVVYFDDEPASQNDSTDLSAIDSDVFAAPGEIFSAPGADVFEAPGEIFEAPGADSDVSATDDSSRNPSSPTTRDSAPVKAESSSPVAAATVLTILMPRMSLLNQYPITFQEAATPKTGQIASDEQVSNQAAGSETAEVVQTEPERRLVTVANNRVTLDARQWPILGKPDARIIFVEMFDYTCPHCRSTHGAIKGALEKYDGELAVLALPVPLERACNDAAGGGNHPGSCELARIAIAVWRANPSRFREFHDWVFETRATPASAKTHAEQLVGAEKFRKEFDSKIPSDYVKRHVDLYKKVGSGSVPKLIFPKSMINGSVSSRDSLCLTIEREFAVQ